MKKWNQQRHVAIGRHLFLAVPILVLLSIPPATLDAQANNGDSTHTHFLFSHITWEAAGPNTAKFTFTAAFRRCTEPGVGFAYPGSDPDGCPAVGDIIDEFIGGTELCFDDVVDPECTGQLRFRVFAINKDDNWLQGRALQPGSDIEETITHDYKRPGTFTAFTETCCRILAPRHINNPSLPYRVESTVDFDTTDSPISLLPPIVDCPRDDICTFTVAAVDPDALDPERPSLTWDLSEPLDMGGFDLRQPPDATINSSTGLYTWDTSGVALAPEGFDTFYSTQVVITDPDGSTSALDFLIRIKELPGPPTGFIRIPLRWCGLEGSPSMEAPGLLGLGTTDRVLLNRHLLMNQRIYVPQARIRFISGARAGGFPILEGPDPEPDETNVGNITNPLTISDDPIHRAWNRCRLAWRDKDPAVTGLIALNINRFVDGNRTPETSILGYAGRPDPNDLGQQLLEGVASVIDRTYFVPQPATGIAPDPNEKWLGHELGHALTLRHVTEGVNLMDNVNAAELTLRGDQVARIRTQADRFIPDRLTNPTLPPLGNTLPDVLDDTPPEEMFVDIDTVGLAVDQEQATTHLVASTFDLFPENILG